MIEVFKTNIDNEHEAEKVHHLIVHEFPEAAVNFDLEDCDKILRINVLFIDARKIIELVISQGYCCEILDN